ncbi:MAG TPA: TonB-dependent receptor, partial [Rhodothermales bacterium]|nr:TonB-dependent receptor [Rhodothermales bacterium]
LFYQEGNVLTTDEIAQLQAQQDHTFTHTERLSYTEPLDKRRLLQADIEHQSISEDQDKAFFDLVEEGSVRNDDLSSAFERTYTYNRAGLNYRYNEERLSYGVGVDVQRSVLDGAILDADATVSNSFTHFLPSASLNYDISNGKHLNLRYNANTREPSMRELQPFTDNSDPLNVYVGNPELRPEYQHNASLHFTLFDQFTFTNFFAFARATYATNSIVRARTIDEQFRQTLTSVNADGDWTLNGSLSFGTPLRRLKSKINISTQTTYNRGIEFINDEENATRILRSSWDVRLDNRNKDIVDASVGARHTFNVNRYSLNQDLNKSYINRSFYADLAYTPTDVWRFSTSLDYQLYAEDVFGSGQSVPLWSAEISRSLLDNQVQVQLVATDLLNKNLGVNYSNTNTYIQEEQINTLGRYVMLKLVYNLSGFGGRNKPAIHIERMGE